MLTVLNGGVKCECDLVVVVIPIDFPNLVLARSTCAECGISVMNKEFIHKAAAKMVKLQQDFRKISRKYIFLLAGTYTHAHSMMACGVLWRSDTIKTKILKNFERSSFLG